MTRLWWILKNPFRHWRLKRSAARDGYWPAAQIVLARSFVRQLERGFGSSDRRLWVRN
jgi:hypothetical protein